MRFKALEFVPWTDTRGILTVFTERRRYDHISYRIVRYILVFMLRIDYNGRIYICISRHRGLRAHHVRPRQALQTQVAMSRDIFTDFNGKEVTPHG